MSRVIMFPHKKIFISNITFGPSIRFLQIAKSLIKKGHEVAIAEKKRYEEEILDGIRFIPCNQELLDKLSEGYDVAITDIWSNDSLFLHAFKKIPLIIDISTPVIAEHATFFNNSERELRYFTEDVLYPSVRIFTYGDMFICANKQQMIYYAGILSLFGRINPYNSKNPPLIILPNGLPSEEFKFQNGFLKGKIVPKDKRVILWPGAMFSWFDTSTPIESMYILSKKLPQVAMIFVGAVSPRAPQSLTYKNFKKTYNKAKELKLLNKNIFFMEWQAYKNRDGIYADSEFAVVTSKQSIESELSHRSRILDCIWGELPIIYDGDDEISKIIKDNSLGLIIPKNSSRELATAISSLIKNNKLLIKLKTNIKIFKKSSLNWEEIIKPLDEFCKNPKKDSQGIALTPQHLLLSKIDLLKEREKNVQLLKMNLTEKNAMIKSLNNQIKKQKESFEKNIEEQKESFEKNIEEQKESFEKNIEEHKLIIQKKEEVIQKILKSKAWRFVKLFDTIMGK